MSKTEVMERLDPNNYKVDAYYLTDEDGKRNRRLYLPERPTYRQARGRGHVQHQADAEQTDKDKEIFVNQQKKIAAFNGIRRRRTAIATVGISKPEHSEEAAPPPPLELPPMESEQEMEVTYHISGPVGRFIE